MLEILRNSLALVSFTCLIAVSKLVLGNICEIVEARSKEYVKCIQGKL